MAKTPRASKASDAKAPGKTTTGKKTAAKKTAAKKTAAAPAPAPTKAAKKTAKKTPAPAPTKAAEKKAAKKTPAAEPAAAKKKAAKKTPATTKATKVPAPASEQLALSMDVDPPASAAAPARPLQPGDRVPDFSLESDDGHTYSRQGLAGTRFVIYFYPKDDTPGCTRQACDFRDNRARFESAGTKVFGVSGDSLKSHGRFRSKYELDFPLLSDPDRAVAQAFGAVGVKKLYGKTSVGVIRSTFVVGPDGTIEKTFSPVKVDGHAAAVLQALGAG